MPDRIIKEKICTSETLNQLSDFEERFWHRLTVNCDDYGRFDARPAVLRGRLIPLMEGKTLKDVEKALSRLASVGLVELYEVDGKPFLRVVKWDTYQRIRAKRSKFPAPSGDGCRQQDAPDSTCRQMTADAVKCPRNPIQSESESESESESNPSNSAEPQSASAPVFALPLNDSSLFFVTQEDIDGWAGLYPAVDVVQELRGMKGWLDANPKKRKTKRGIRQFINGWLSRTQDNGGSRNVAESGGNPGGNAWQELPGVTRL